MRVPPPRSLVSSKESINDHTNNSNTIGVKSNAGLKRVPLITMGGMKARRLCHTRGSFMCQTLQGP
eukprot:SAG11_NODE_26925_length_339_cov_0.662500_1_plen_65_part_01